MTWDIALTLSILCAAVVLFIGEWIRADLVALLVLVALVLTGLVTPDEGISGFANPAVVTIWAMFILSAGLAKTGVASWMGLRVVRLAGKTEGRLLTVLMSISAAISSIMYTVGVVAMLLPATMDVARRTRRPPSRLLLPMAYAAMAGGMLTLIGTSSNLVVVDFLRAADLPPLHLFDFTPVGLAIVVATMGYILVFGRRILPAHRTPEATSKDGRIRETPADTYGLADRLAILVVPESSPLVGRTLSESRVGLALGLNVLRVQHRSGRRQVPSPELVIEPGDRLLVLGRLDTARELLNRPFLRVDAGIPVLSSLLSSLAGLAEIRVEPGSIFDGKSPASLDLRHKMGLTVLAMRRGDTVRRTHLQDLSFQPGDRILVQGSALALNEWRSQPGFTLLGNEQSAAYHLEERLLTATIPAGSALVGRSLRESRLGEAFGISVLAVCHVEQGHCVPEADVVLNEGDRLILEGRPLDLEVLRGLQSLQVDSRTKVELRELEDGHLGVAEVMLSPHTTLTGKTVRQLRLRERFGISVLAIWRGDRPYRTGLGSVALRFGDGLLCYGSREAFELLAKEPDFVVLEVHVQEKPNFRKAPLASLIMAGLLGSVLLGWIPIVVAALAGASLMVLSRCLTMEDAHRGIEWKAVFLIAAMLPLGLAMQRTGAASLLAAGVLEVTGPFGPTAVLGGLLLCTLLLNQFIPSAVNAVVMTPIALATAMELQVSPYPFVMGIAYAVATSFMTPVSHPALLMVMSPGNYRFKDYMRSGLPIVIIVFVVCVGLLPLVFPF
jgi:di/tricarboxylate transporter